MTTTAKEFLQLLQIAVNNGWEDHYGFSRSNIAITSSNIVCIQDYGQHCVSLNDFVCNWEEGEVSFLDALSTASKKYDMKTFGHVSQNRYNYPYAFRYLWNETSTSQRVELLLHTFKHLL